MAHYDKLTMDFMEKVSEGGISVAPIVPPKPDDEIIEDRARRGLSSIRALKEHGITGLISKAIFPTIAEKLFQKTGSVSVLSTFNYLNSKYDVDWWEWEPETVWAMLKQDEGIEASSEVKNLVLALQVVMKTNAAHENWHIFENVCQAFNGNSVDFSTLQPAELTDIALTIKVLNNIRPKQEFDDEVMIYIAASARNSGVVYLPSQLYEGDGSYQKHLEGMDANPDGNKNLVKAVAEAWGSGNLKSGNEMVDMQLAKLNEIKEYVEEHYG